MAPISDNYRSRTNKDSAIISRREPVVYSNVEAIANESTKSIVHGFERDGYALIEDLFLKKRFHLGMRKFSRLLRLRK